MGRIVASCPKPRAGEPASPRTREPANPDLEQSSPHRAQSEEVCGFDDGRILEGQRSHGPHPEL